MWFMEGLNARVRWPSDPYQPYQPYQKLSTAFIASTSRVSSLPSSIHEKAEPQPCARFCRHLDVIYCVCTVRVLLELDASQLRQCNASLNVSIARRKRGEGFAHARAISWTATAPQKPLSAHSNVKQRSFRK